MVPALADPQRLPRADYSRAEAPGPAGVAGPGYGAADGVLALPLAAWGCRVTALEPAGMLREGLPAGVRGMGLPAPMVLEKTWEEYNSRDGEPYDLVLACNSLHLVAAGFRKALAKIFTLKPKRVLVVAEERASGLFNLNQSGYDLHAFLQYATGSHFAYHSPREVLAHYEACFGVRPNPEDLGRLLRRLCFAEGHWWLKEQVQVRIFFWSRRLEEQEA